ncbi:hypothetical protein Afil01_09540 [Actinorhabdospora filicis]|uniref:Uncharacterized protein n=1 Tax=Actinorhabdospora filicis TaxID=1785913 RepID=A0A9W6W1Q3_9ACTN|nr:hypothetical protein [Actinorhabdospora filicis]GLZ76147.1 hypothetical protein Afil01_09540 [Actinorhabdospora filicis]
MLRKLLKRIDRRVDRAAEKAFRSGTEQAIADLRLRTARGVDELHDALAGLRAELEETRAEVAVLRDALTAREATG